MKKRMENSEFSGKKVLVTGGAGFIGSHLSDTLVDMGAKVTVADNFSRGSKNKLARIRDMRILEVDLRTISGALKATEGQDIVLNLAAFNTGVDYDVGRTQVMFEENMLLQLMPLRAAGENHVPLFTQISTASIYSTDAMEKRVPTLETDDGGDPEISKLGYALAKRMGERLALWYATNTQMQTRRIRFINVYGTRDHFDGLGHFMPAIIKKFDDVPKNGTVHAFGSGNQKRSFLHVLDAVNAILTVSNKGINGEVYNVDPQDEHSIKEVVEIIRLAMKKHDVSVVWDASAPEGSKRRMLDNKKIRALGWVPQRKLDGSTIGEMVEDILKRRHEND